MMEATTTFDLLDAWRVLWRGKWRILLIGLTGAILALLFSTTLQKMYVADGSVVVRAAALTSPDSDAAFGAGVVNEAVVTTEQDVLRAPGLLERVAARVTFPPALVQPHPGLAQRGADWLRHAAGIFGPAAQRPLDAGYAWLFPPKPQTPLMDQQRRLQYVESALTTTAGKDSSVINVHAVTSDPQLSADIVNTVLRYYMDDRAAEQNRTATLIQAALTERLRHTEQQIAEKEDQLATLMKEPGAVDSSEIPGDMRDMALIGSQLAQAQAELARRRAEYDSATQIKDGRVFSAPDSVDMTDLRRSLTQAQSAYAALSTELGPNHPRTLAAQHQIAALQSQIAAETGRGIGQRRSDLAAAQATVDSLQKQFDALRAKRQATTSESLDLNREKEALASLWRISDVLQTRLIDMAARPANLNARILTEATVPTLAAYPERSLYVLGGFVLASAAAIAWVLIGSHIYRQQPAPFQLALQFNVPLLGGLPQLAGRKSQRRLVASAVNKARGDVVGDTLISAAIEVENVVRRGELRCLMATSAFPGEGKTTVAVALGRTLAASGLRVLLIDLDLRRPSVERAFNASVNRPLVGDILSLTDQVIELQVDEASGVHLYAPKMVFPDTSPAQLLRSKKLQSMVEQVRSRYDLVLFDTPPVMSVPDALVIADRVDALLLITELGRSQDPEIEEFSRRLARTGKPICGVIVTKVKTEDIYRAAY